MDEIQLQAKKRTIIGKQVKVLRREGLIPGIVYGGEGDPIPVELDALDTSRILTQTSASSLIALKVGRKSHTVLLRDIQYDVIRREPIHVDFLEVAMDETIRTTVPIEFVGEAPGVKELGGVLVTGLNELEIEALPADLPDRISVDLEILDEIDTSISVRDLLIGQGVEVLTNSNEVIAHIVYQEIEEIIEEEVEEIVDTLLEPELVERGKEDEEGEEED